MSIPYFILVAVFLLCNAARMIYERLKNSGTIDVENRTVFLLIFAAMFILWSSWFALCPIEPYRIDLPDSVRWIAFGLTALGLALFIGAFLQLRGFENIDHLVTSGVFARLRHPMYTSFILWIVGWSLYHGALLSLGIGFIGVANILWWRHLEEGGLLAQFGAAYSKYREQTWF